MNKEEKINRFEKLTELKNKLYELHGVDKFESMNEIYNEIRKHDKELADTLTLITSDFNTQLNIQQNHFIHVLDTLITLEEKRLIAEVSRPLTSRATDKEKTMEEVINVNPVINITNTQDQKVEPAKQEKKGFLSEGTVKVLVEYKWFIIIVVLLGAVYFDPKLVDHVFKLIKTISSSGGE